MISSRTGGYCTQKNNWVKIGTILDLSPNYSCLQIHFLEITSLVCANFAYNDRHAWYLTGVGGHDVWKKYFSLETSHMWEEGSSSLCFNAFLHRVIWSKVISILLTKKTSIFQIRLCFLPLDGSPDILESFWLDVVVETCINSCFKLYVLRML